MEAEELERITESHHHEGICIVAASAPPRALAEILAAPGPGWLVALAGVENPHNTGAIVRTAAHFGARAVVIEGSPKRLPPVVYRTAQGGAEWVEVVGAPVLSAALDEARRAGFTICATSSHGGTDLFAAAIPARAVIVLGAEDAGLSPDLREEGRADVMTRSPAASTSRASTWAPRRPSCWPSFGADTPEGLIFLRPMRRFLRSTVPGGGDP